MTAPQKPASNFVIVKSTTGGIRASYVSDTQLPAPEGLISTSSADVYKGGLILGERPHIYLIV